MSESDDEQVRRLLADARHTEPMPPDVVDRLDGVLAELGAPPTAAHPESRPTDLAAVRRRRNARTWLIAAAAVVAVGIGANQLDLTSSEGDNDSASSAQDSASQPGAGSDAGSDAGAGDSAPEVAEGSELEAAPQDSYSGALRTRGGEVLLSSDRFGAQVRKLSRRSKLQSATLSSQADQLTALTKGCRDDARTGTWGKGRVVPARYDGAPAVIVVRPVEGQTQVVDLFLCGQDQAERSITLPMG